MSKSARACLYVSKYVVRIRASVHLFMYASECMYIGVRACVFVRISTCVYMNIYVRKRECVNTDMCVRTCVCGQKPSRKKHFMVYRQQLASCANVKPVLYIPLYSKEFLHRSHSVTHSDVCS